MPGGGRCPWVGLVGLERSGTGWSSRGPPGSDPRPLGRLGGGPLIHRTVFRGWVRPGGTNAASDVMGVASHPAAERTDKHKALRLRDGRSFRCPCGSQSAHGTELPGQRPPEGQCPSGAHGEQNDVEGFRVGLGPALNASTPSEVMIE